MKRLFVYLKKYKKELFLGPFFKFLEALFEITVPLVMARIIDNGILKNNSGYIFSGCGLLIIFAVAGLSCALVCQYFAAKCAYGFGADLKSDLYRHINSFSSAELDRLGKASLVTRINNDSNLVQTGVNMFIRLAVRAPFIIIGSILMSLTINVRMTLIFVAIAPVIAFILYKIMHITVPGYKKNQAEIDRMTGRVSENIDGTRVIRAFSRQEEEISSFNKEAEDYGKQVNRVSDISSLMNSLSVLIMNIGVAVVIILGGNMINTGELSQGELTSFVSYMIQISLALVVLADLLNTFTKAESSAKRIAEVLEVKPSIKNGSETFEKATDDKDQPFIEFSNVSFRYPGAGADSIENISFKIYKGQTIGIIGGTGSGKSTLVQLIMRNYDVTAGRILINGKDIRSYTTESLKKMTGYVPQKAVLFKGSVAENLRFGCEEASYDEMTEALKDSCAWDFIQMLPKQLNSHVSQGGRNFSGGQRQRLTIARAMTGHPGLLIFDDSMSALDFATDLRLRKNLAEKYRDSTLILISQRASTLKNADNIIVLEEGRCTGFASHEKLLETNQAYKEIYDTQIMTN